MQNLLGNIDMGIVLYAIIFGMIDVDVIVYAFSLGIIDMGVMLYAMFLGLLMWGHCVCKIYLYLLSVKILLEILVCMFTLVELFSTVLCYCNKIHVYTHINMYMSAICRSFVFAILQISAVSH